MYVHDPSRYIVFGLTPIDSMNCIVWWVLVSTMRETSLIIYCRNACINSCIPSTIFPILPPKNEPWMHDILVSKTSHSWPPNNTDHCTEHCLATLRQGVMCHGDVSVMTMVWGKHSRIPLGDFANPHQCVNFDKLHDWAMGRAVVNGVEPGVLVHPKLGMSSFFCCFVLVGLMLSRCFIPRRTWDEDWIRWWRYWPRWKHYYFERLVSDRVA